MNNVTILVSMVAMGLSLVTIFYGYTLERDLVVTQKINQACESQLIYYEKLLDDNSIPYRG